MAKKKPSTILPSERILNCIPSRETDKDWSFGDALGSGDMATAPPPPAKDLREGWWNVGDQKSTGSCVGWATADGVLRWHLTKAGRIRTDEHLSVRFVWMSAKETDEYISCPTTFIENAGTSLQAALDITRKFGIVPDSMLPFAQATLSQDNTNVFYAQAARNKITSFFSLGRDMEEWRSWLAFNGPILTRLNVDATWFDATENKGKLDAYQPDTVRGGHAVCLVGYTPDHFIVRNSWGEDWGDNGFAYAANGYAAKAFTEAYGICP